MQSDLPVNATFWLTRINTMHAKMLILFILITYELKIKLSKNKRIFLLFFYCSIQILQNKANRRVLLNAVSVFQLTCFCIVECMLYAYIHCVVNCMTRVAFRKKCVLIAETYKA